MEKVSPYGYVVEVTKVDDEIDGKWKTYTIIADSYMDLIAGIDSIQSTDGLDWGSPTGSDDGYRLRSGLPSKSEGKWKAELYGQYKPNTFRYGN
tara:strand:+ start:1874 stop:2155 length:282 start_codon:yes stop_codon:yes gene_type:complete